MQHLILFLRTKYIDTITGFIIEDISDHFLIFTLCKLINIVKSKQPMYNYKGRLYNKDNLCVALYITTWENVVLMNVMLTNLVTTFSVYLPKN